MATTFAACDLPSPQAPPMPLYHRLASSTQRLDVAFHQTHSGEVWGTGAFLTGIASVKAYLGPLPAGYDGIEFETNIAPTPGTSTLTVAYWYQGQAQAAAKSGFVMIPVSMKKVAYTQPVNLGAASCVF